MCGFNDSNGNSVANLMGWSWSGDGVTWHYCNPTLAGCGNPPMVAGMTAWHGDPILVADGKGNVAYISMADTDVSKSNGAYVVAALSSDGGKTFPTTVLVNDNQAPSPPYPCPTAAEDQPTADFDITTDINHARKISVAWRHNGSTTWGACIRTGIFCGVGETDPACSGKPTPSVVWDWGSGNGVSNLTRNDAFYGQSGIIVQSGNGAVALVYANCDGSMVNCPDTSLHGCSWQRVISYDDGYTWSSSVNIDTTSTLKTCVLNGGSPPNGGALETRHRATFGFTRDRRNGDYYVSTMHGQSDLRLFRSQNQGGSWTQVVQLSYPSTSPTIAMPTLASDTAGRLAWSFLISQSADTQVTPMLATVASVITPDNPDPGPDPGNWAYTQLAGYYAPPVGGVRAIGDYNGIAVADPIVNSTCTATSRFLPAWTDTLQVAAGYPFLVHAQEVDVTP